MPISTYRPGQLGAPGRLILLILLLASSSCRDMMGSSGKKAVQVLWRTPLDLPDRGFHYPAATGDRLFALLGGVVAYDANSGKLLWRKPLNKYMPRGVVVRDGRLFTAETWVFALDAASGQELWHFAPDSSADFAQGTADDQSFYIGTRSHRVYALGVTSGTPMWSTDIGPDWEFGGIVSGLTASGDTVYVTAERSYAPNGYLATGWIVALDRNTGRILWEYENGKGQDLRNFISAPTVAGSLLIASDRKGNSVVAVNRFTGIETWRVNGIPGYIGFTSPPVVAGDTVYAASGDTYVYGIGLHTGQVIWRTSLGTAVEAAALCGEFVFANDYGIAVLDRHTGKLLRRMYDSEVEFTTSAFAVANDRVFVLGNKAAYAFSCE